MSIFNHNSSKFWNLTSLSSVYMLLLINTHSVVIRFVCFWITKIIIWLGKDLGEQFTFAAGILVADEVSIWQASFLVFVFCFDYYCRWKNKLEEILLCCYLFSSSLALVFLKKDFMLLYFTINNFFYLWLVAKNKRLAVFFRSLCIPFMMQVHCSTKQ